jgi:hypothetical protein
MNITFRHSLYHTNWYTWSVEPDVRFSFLAVQKAAKEFLSRFESVEYMNTYNKDYHYFKFKNKEDEAYFLLLSSDGIEI